MSWCTDLFCNVTFNRETFNSRSLVEDRIDEVKSCIKSCKETLRDLVFMTEPAKFITDEQSVWSAIDNLVRDNLELLEEYTVELYKLELLLENWDNCHTPEGLAINPPEGINWKTAFLDGDFINTVENPNNE